MATIGELSRLSEECVTRLATVESDYAILTLKAEKYEKATCEVGEMSADFAQGVCVSVIVSV